jgi:hypothetical protein
MPTSDALASLLHRTMDPMTPLLTLPNADLGARPIAHSTDFSG